MACNVLNGVPCWNLRQNFRLELHNSRVCGAVMMLKCIGVYYSRAFLSWWLSFSFKALYSILACPPLKHVWRRGKNSNTFNNNPSTSCQSNTACIQYVFVMMSAKCSNDLMNTSITGKQDNMKEKYSPHRGLSNFNYLSGECILHAYQNIFDL